MNIIASNLKYLRKQKKLTQQGLADELEVKRPVIGAYEESRAEPKTSLLIRMADFFGITTDELIGQRLSDEYFARKKREAEKASRNQLRVLSVTVDKKNRENVELVPARASAGYLNGYADPEFISELPKFHLPMLKGGTFRAFELNGDSMLPLQPGTVVVGEYLEHLDDIKPGNTYVLLTKNDGIVYKRVKKEGKKTLRLISDNKSYDSYTIAAEEILEIWKAKAYISTQLPRPE